MLLFINVILEILVKLGGGRIGDCLKLIIMLEFLNVLIVIGRFVGVVVV